MSLLDHVVAQHFAAKKAAQEAKVKREEGVDDENLKSENVKSDLKQEDKMLSFKELVARKVRRAAVLSTLDSDNSDMPVLEDLGGYKKVQSRTRYTTDGTQGFKNDSVENGRSHEGRHLQGSYQNGT